jgi:hypothetical protein
MMLVTSIVAASQNTPDIIFQTDESIPFSSIAILHGS